MLAFRTIEEEEFRKLLQKCINLGANYGEVDIKNIQENGYAIRFCLNLMIKRSQSLLKKRLIYLGFHLLWIFGAKNLRKLNIFV